MPIGTKEATKKAISKQLAEQLLLPDVVYTCRVEQVEQEGALVALLDPHNLLRDVLAGAANTTHSQEDVVIQEVSRQHLEEERIK